MAQIGPVLVSIAIQAAIAIAATLIINALFPIKIEGPRLTDLRVQVSTYGRAIALLYGSDIRIAGNVIDSTGLIERRTEESAKGGPTVTSYTYSTDVHVLLGAARPRARLKKIIANGKLIYDAEALAAFVQDPSNAGVAILIALKGGLESATVQSLRFYTGDQDQEPDPFFESVRGVGNVPAYIGSLSVVIQGLQLADFGNVLPNLEFIIEADACDTYKSACEEIVGLAGIPDNMKNFDCLSSLPLRGYSVGRVMTAAQALSPLTFAGYFDIVDDGGYLRSVFREDEAVGVISTEDLGGHAFGDERPDPITFERAPTVALPREATIVFFDPDRDMQENAQTARRAGGSADSNITFELALTLTVDEARALADRGLWESWMMTQTAKAPATERLIDIKVGRVYLFETPAGLEPWRILSRTLGANGVIELELKRERSEIYAPTQIGASAPAPDNDLEIPGLTELILLDIPILREADDDPGFYYAVVGSESGWRGAAVMRALDLTSDYLIFDTVGVQSPAGDCLNTLPDGPTEIDDGESDDTFDDVNYLDVDLRHSGLELESVDDAAIAAGFNAAYVGPADPTVDGEIIQWGIATPLTDNVVRLTHLKRGKRGTEYATGLHTSGEIFVKLSLGDTRRADFGTPDLNQERAYKGVSILHSSDMYTPQLFTNTGVGLRPYSPIHLSIEAPESGTGTGDGGDLLLTWTRRSRLDSGILGEETELYTIRILDGSGTTVLREEQSTEESFLYTEDMQVEDFGAPVTHLCWRVAQVSAIFGNGIFSESCGPVVASSGGDVSSGDASTGEASTGDVSSGVSSGDVSSGISSGDSSGEADALQFIDEVITSGAASNVQFASIPQGYRHLWLIWSARCNGFGGQTGLRMRINGDTGNNYHGEAITGWGTDQYDATENLSQSFIKIGDVPMSLADGGFFSAGDCLIHFYSEGTQNKKVVGSSACSRNGNSGETNISKISGFRVNDDAVTQLDIFCQSNNFEDGSRFTLYGIE